MSKQLLTRDQTKRLVEILEVIDSGRISMGRDMLFSFITENSNNNENIAQTRGPYNGPDAA